MVLYSRTVNSNAGSRIVTENLFDLEPKEYITNSVNAIIRKSKKGTSQCLEKQWEEPSQYDEERFPKHTNSIPYQQQLHMHGILHHIALLIGSKKTLPSCPFHVNLSPIL